MVIEFGCDVAFLVRINLCLNDLAY